MSTAVQSNSSKIREALEKAIAWADVEADEMEDSEFSQRHNDLALALGILHKWREEEAS